MAPIVIVGVHPVREALRAGQVREIRVGPRTDARVTEIVRLAEARGVTVRRVDTSELDRLAVGERQTRPMEKLFLHRQRPEWRQRLQSHFADLGRVGVALAQLAQPSSHLLLA